MQFAPPLTYSCPESNLSPVSTLAPTFTKGKVSTWKYLVRYLVSILGLHPPVLPTISDGPSPTIVHHFPSHSPSPFLPIPATKVPAFASLPLKGSLPKQNISKTSLLEAQRAQANESENYLWSKNEYKLWQRTNESQLEAGWQKLRTRSPSSGRKVRISTKGRVPNIGYFVANSRFVAIYANISFLLWKFANTAFLARKFANTRFLSQKFANARSTKGFVGFFLPSPVSRETCIVAPRVT